MGIDTTTPSSRRALLAGLAGGLAAAVAATLGRAQPASAHDPDDVWLGAPNSATSETSITNTAVNGTAFAAWAPAARAIGVVGYASLGTGVVGTSNVGNGVMGLSRAKDASGVYGENSYQGYGVAGRSNSPSLGTGGVFAAATLGDNTAGGIGVWARAAHGVGLFAEAVNPDAIALKAEGITKFSRSGSLTVKAGTLSVTKTGIRVEAGTLVLAALQHDRPGVHVRSAVPNAVGDSFTIRLNEAVANDTRVAWFLVN